MMYSKSGRLGILLSVVWLLGGGYWSFARHSYYHYLTTDNAEQVCEITGEESIVCQTDLNNILPIEWGSIALEIAVGLAVIWLGIFAYKWIKSADK